MSEIVNDHHIREQPKGTRVIVTVLGRDRVGIIAGLTTVLANRHVNILDLSQTILQGIFTMVMIVDIANANVDFNDLAKELAAKGEELGLKVQAQHEDVFEFMHRI